MVGRWSSIAQCGSTSHHAQQLCLTLVTSSLDGSETLQTAKRPRRSSLEANMVRALSVLDLEETS